MSTQKRRDDLRDRVDELEDLLDQNVTTLHARIGTVVDRLDELEEDLDDLEEAVKVKNATASDRKAGKVEKAIDVLEFAASEKQGGYAGVKVTSGEVAGAADCSKSRALTLMDEIAGLPWAETESPGGPKPKVLRLRVGDRDVQELVDDVLEEWGEVRDE